MFYARELSTHLMHFRQQPEITRRAVRAMHNRATLGETADMLKDMVCDVEMLKLKCDLSIVSKINCNYVVILIKQILIRRG